MPAPRYATDRDAQLTPEHHDGRILAPASGNRLYALNAIGAWIWSRLEADTPASEIVSQLVAASGAPIDQVERDVAAFLSDLERKGLIRPAI